MKYLRLLLIIIIAFNLTHCNNKASIATEEELLEAIDKFNKAFQKGDNTVLESMITENYMHTNGNSQSIGKTEWLNYLNKRKSEIESGNLEVITYELDERKIEFYGNTAIVTGKIKVSNKKDAEIQKNEYRVTNIWINDNGNWKRAGFHDGKIK